MDTEIPDEALVAVRDTVGGFWDRYQAEIRDVLTAAAPLIIAAELRRLAAEYRHQYDRQVEYTKCLERDDATALQIESSVSSQCELSEFVKALEARARELRASTTGDDQ